MQACNRQPQMLPQRKSSRLAISGACEDQNPTCWVQSELTQSWKQPFQCKRPRCGAELAIPRSGTRGSSSGCVGRIALPRKSLDFFAPLRSKFLMTHRSPRLLRLVGMPLISLALFALVGGHWAVLQTIAWAQMLRDYSKNAPIIEAIAKTFSGRSPCGMCTKISEERQKGERAPAAAKFDKKGEVFLVEVCDALKRFSLFARMIPRRNF